MLFAKLQYIHDASDDHFQYYIIYSDSQPYYNINIIAFALNIYIVIIPECSNNIL